MSELKAKIDATIQDVHARKLVELLHTNSFFQDVWERRELHLSSVFDTNGLQEIFPLSKFDEVLTSGALVSPHLDIVRDGKKCAAPFTVSPSPATDVGRVLHDLKQGATIRVAHIEHYLPSLSRFCRGLEQVLQIPIRANLYMTPPFSQGFQPHFDLDDIFVVQVLGQKEWFWHPNYANQAALPNTDMPFVSSKHSLLGAPKPIMMKAGDVLYLPRGFMHEARTDEVASIHITFAPIGTTLGKFIEQMVRKLTISDVRLRRTVSFAPDQENDEQVLDQLASEIRSCLEGLTTRQALSEAAEFMRQSMSRHRNPDLQGKLLEALNN
ncbi:cupin domain-containing protein [Massilia sp. W12]|uniref:JmjC domain-containing protein n=1 Tax=Massilia sp. W12 TaxID=3126507 RepID=UPI0030D05F65